MQPPKPDLPREPGRSRYSILADALRARLLRGEWPPGSAIPAEQLLAAEHGVALGTVRQALQLLVDEGLIERRQGRGTFVRQGLSGATLLRFFRFAGDGEIPGSRIVGRRRRRAPADIAGCLGLPSEGPALEILRLRTLARQPCLFEQIWLPLPLFAELAGSDTAQWGDLLYPLYAQRCGVHVHRACDEVRFEPLSATHAAHLALPVGHPGAVVTRHAFDIAGRCIEARITRGDAFAFRYTTTIT